MIHSASRARWIERSWRRPIARSRRTMRSAFSAASAALPSTRLRTSEYAPYTAARTAISRSARLTGSTLRTPWSDRQIMEILRPVVAGRPPHGGFPQSGWGPAGTREAARMATRIEGHAGEQAVAAMLRFGTDVMFTLNGGPIWPLYDAARKQGMRVVDTRHEQSATFAAEAYAKLTRRPGFAALTAGPGITNGVSAITSAWFNGSPV